MTNPSSLEQTTGAMPGIASFVTFAYPLFQGGQAEKGKAVSTAERGITPRYVILLYCRSLCAVPGYEIEQAAREAEQQRILAEQDAMLANALAERKAREQVCIRSMFCFRNYLRCAYCSPMCSFQRCHLVSSSFVLPQADNPITLIRCLFASG